MTDGRLATPQEIELRLDAIEQDLAERQGRLEAAALAWFVKKRDREKDRAIAFLNADSLNTVAQRDAEAEKVTADIGAEEEGTWEGLRAVVKVLEARATIGMSLLRSAGRT